MTQRQALLLFSYLEYLNTVRRATKAPLVDACYASGIDMRELEAMLDKFDSLQDQWSKTSASKTDEEMNREWADIAHEVTGDGYDMDPIGIIVPDDAEAL